MRLRQINRLNFGTSAYRGRFSVESLLFSNVASSLPFFLRLSITIRKIHEFVFLCSFKTPSNEFLFYVWIEWLDVVHIWFCGWRRVHRNQLNLWLYVQQQKRSARRHYSRCLLEIGRRQEMTPLIYCKFLCDCSGDKCAACGRCWVMRRLQLRFDFDSTAVRLLIKDHSDVTR